MKHVVITGVSTGMGHEMARHLMQAGYHVFGSVRKQADADALQAELGDAFTPLLFDVTDEEAVHAAADLVGGALNGQGLDGLVNNAGLAESGPLMHQPIAEFRNQIEVNLTGQLIVTQAFLPLLGASLPQTNPPGRIVNISSVGGRIATPFIGAYAASKHGLEALSDALRRELMIYGIDVIVVQPAGVQTPIWDKAEQIDIAPYAKTDYYEILLNFQKMFIKQGREGWTVDVIAKTVQEALESPKPKARYALPTQPVQGWLLPRLLPDRVLDGMMGKMIGLTRKS